MTGLFHRGISQSGASLCSWGFTRQPKKQAKRLAEQLNCTTEASKSSLELVKCLRKKAAHEIVQVHREITVKADILGKCNSTSHIDIAYTCRESFHSNHFW